jgi:hypothetical protein
MREPSILISHAKDDEQVIREFVDLLQTGCDIRQKAISCTSIEGTDVGTGDKFVDWIEEHLAPADLVILFVTPNYLASRFCIAEMGASWALNRPVYPLVAPGVDRDLGTVMLGRQTVRVDATGLDKLYTQVTCLFLENGSKVEHWNVQKNAFLERFGELFFSLPKPKTVSQEALRSVEDELKAAMQIKKEDRKRISELEDQVALLEQVKDAKEVEAIRRQFDHEEEYYLSLTTRIRGELQRLDPVEVRCLYASIALSGWQPSGDTWHIYRSDIDGMLERKRIVLLEEGNHTELLANSEQPSYKGLIGAIDELKHFINEEASGDLLKRLQDDNETFIDVRNRDYWERVPYGKRLLD